LFRVQNMTDEL